MSRQMKDSGIEWVGAIPEKWQTGRLQRCLIEIKEKNNPIRTTRVLSLTNKLGVIPYEDKGNQGNKAKEDYSQYGLAFEDTLVVNSMNVLIGSVGISKYYGCVSPVYYVFKNDVNSDLRFINYLFQNTGFQKELRKYANGILEIRLRVSTHDMLRRRIPMPSFIEQVAISDYLDDKCAEIDSIIDKTRASIEEYKKLKQAIITQAVTKGVRGERKMKDSGIEWIGEIPEEWTQQTLGNISLSLRNGYVGPTKNLFVEKGIRYIQSLHIKDGRIDFSRKEYYVTKEWADNHPKIHENDLLIVQTGDIGSVATVTAEYDQCNCHALIIMTPNNQLIDSDYLSYYLRSSAGKEELLFHRTGALLPHLNAGKIKFASICVPAINEQRSIVEYLNDKTSAIDLLLLKKEKLLNELELYKKSLIYEYVTGKKEVPA